MDYKVVIEGKKFDNVFTIDEQKLDFLMRVLRSKNPFAMKLWSEEDVRSVADSGTMGEPTEDEIDKAIANLDTDVFEDCRDYEWDEIYRALYEAMEG